MTPQGKVIAVVVGSACALAAGAVLYERVNGTASNAPVGAAPIATEAGPDDPVADWCAPGFEPIRGNACLAFVSGKPAPLVVYLHGRYARDAASEEVDRQRRLAARATRLGFAVIALRGRLGTCTAQELAQWYCWPSNPTNADAGPDFVDGWTPALAAAQERTGSRRRFLLGFSNGGYFAGLVASRSLLAFDAIVVAHGGPVEPVHAFRGTPPLLLLSADDDVAQDEMIRFDEELTREHWAHDSYARAGGHGLTDEDIDAALMFFSRAHEPLPLQPPLALHRAIRHARDAGAEGQIQADETPLDAQSAPAEDEQEPAEAPRPTGTKAPAEPGEREAGTTTIGASPSGAGDTD